MNFKNRLMGLDKIDREFLENISLSLELLGGTIEYSPESCRTELKDLNTDELPILYSLCCQFSLKMKLNPVPLDFLGIRTRSRRELINSIDRLADSVVKIIEKEREPTRSRLLKQINRQ